MVFHDWPWPRLAATAASISRRSVFNWSSRAASAAIIAAVLGLGRALELDVVAEGIETEAQRQTLLDMGCHYGQGFYFGRPQPVEHWLEHTQTAT